jgi:hypothetical protein
MRNSAWRIRIAVTVALLAIAGGAVTACGGGKSGKGGTPASASADPFEQGRKFARCMREHGVDLPDPGQGGGGLLSPSAGQRLDPNSPTVKAAREACKAFDPNVGGAAPPPIDPTQLAQMRDYAKCMREHGVDMPDPDPGANGGGNVLNTNPNDPVFKAAGEACKDKVPNGVANTMGPGK